jgi:hypothetical protein
MYVWDCENPAENAEKTAKNIKYLIFFPLGLSNDLKNSLLLLYNNNYNIMYQSIFLILILLIASAEAKLALFLSGCPGYTWYSPDALNRLNTILRQTSEDYDIKGYGDETFSGAMDLGFSCGAIWNNITIDLQVERWHESFVQKDLTFDYITTQGRINVYKEYVFMPVVFTLKYRIPVKKVVLSPGYSAGVMLGRANISIATEFSTGLSDSLSYDLTSGINLVQKIGVHACFAVVPWFGLGIEGGYRISNIKYFKVSRVRGHSFIFNMLINDDPAVDDRIQIQDNRMRFARQSEENASMQTVNGDMSGFYLWLKFIFIRNIIQ